MGLEPVGCSPGAAEDCEPRVGQHYFVKGTGKWWSGQSFGVVIVDIGEANGSVKVRYADGGYKRFPADVFRSLLTEQQTVVRVGHDGWEPLVGQRIYIAGTSKWWEGEHYRAVIVDVRGLDDTVKVQYTDGRYKRFSRSVLKSLVVERPATPALWEDWRAPAETTKSRGDELHDRIVLAMREHDYLKAAGLEDELRKLSENEAGANALRTQLVDAVKRGDYLEAHRLQQQLKIADDKAGQQKAHASVEAATATAAAAVSEEEGMLWRSAKRALGGGLAGMSAMSFQVVCFYWLRTTMNFQYRYGTSTREALRTLYAAGGARRFYRGFGAAFLYGPLARFTDTAANAGVLALLEETEARAWPAWARTFFASGAAATMRLALLPVDTVKTILQVHGREGLVMLAGKYRMGGAPVLFHGAMASSAATFVGHYPWFVIFNTLDERLPVYQEKSKAALRNGCIGFCASLCSDTLTNVLRVVKTCRQTRETTSYASIVRKVVQADGLTGLLGRGLQTRLVANGGQGIVFASLYKLFEEHFIQR